MKVAILKDVEAILETQAVGFEAEVEALSLIRKHDEYTYLHSLNVARLSVMLGKRLGLSQSDLIDLGWAALLHDLGKLHVPPEVLNKVKKFTPEELAIMQGHPLESIMAYVETQAVSLDGLRRLSAAFEHHQRFDLKGYPSVQRKLNLHPYSRIVSVADSFDAMTTDRIYQRRVLPDVALKIMAQGYGSVFDPVVLQAFITSMGAYPVGSLVRLSTDELGVVSHYTPTSRLDRPRVKLVDQKKEMDLMDPAHSTIRILRSERSEDHNIDVREVLWK